MQQQLLLPLLKPVPALSEVTNTLNYVTFSVIYYCILELEAFVCTPLPVSLHPQVHHWHELLLQAVHHAQPVTPVWQAVNMITASEILHHLIEPFGVSNHDNKIFPVIE